jgi:hypothetical protein
MALAAVSQENAAKISSLAKDVPKELTINGKPYSQYKAEQDALKKQQEARQVVTQSQKEISINAADWKPAPVKVQPVESKPNNGAMVDDGKTNPLKEAIEMSKIVPKVKETVAEKPVIVEQPSAIKIGETLDPIILNDSKVPVTTPQKNEPAAKVNTKPAEIQKPQVPEQFKLPENPPTWGNKSVADKTAQTAAQTTSVKLPEVKFVKEDATPKTTTSSQTLPVEKQPSSTDTNLPVKKQN